MNNAILFTHKELVEKSKLGDSKMQYKLYSLYVDAMFNVSIRIVKIKEDAEDVVQDSFIDAFKRFDFLKVQDLLAIYQATSSKKIKKGEIIAREGDLVENVYLIRKISYWNFSNLKPRDPVILALCTQETFQKAIDKAKRRVEREKKAKLREEKKAQAASV